MYKYLLLIFAILFVSCKTRNVELTKTKEINISDSLVKIKNDINIVTDFKVRNNYIYYEKITEPNGTITEKYSNNVIATYLKKVKQDNTQTEIKVKKKALKEVKKKLTESKETSKTWLVWIGLFMVIAGLIYFLISKYKPKITDLLKFKK